MRAKLCGDDKYRILAKIIVPMGLIELTTFALANTRFYNNHNAMNEFFNLNKRQVFKVAKEYVLANGNDLHAAKLQSLDFWTSRQISRATEHVTMLFPEVS
jgi:hypothetical protein